MLGFRAFLGRTVDDDPANRRGALIKVDVLPTSGPLLRQGGLQ